jgi:sugar lactone lactonase YvrE
MKIEGAHNFIGTLATLVSLAFLSGCGGGGSAPPPPQVIAVSVSPTSQGVLLGATQQFTGTVTGTTNTSVNWSVNGVAGGNATVGTISSSGSYTAPKDLPNPAKVTITGTSQADTSKHADASVTVTSDIAVTVAASPAGTQAVPTGSTLQFTASISSAGNPDNSVKWAVNGIPNGNGTVGTIDAAGLYAAPPTVPTPFTVTIAAASVADSSKSASSAVIVAGTIASVTQSISATSGGTITLPDGSSVTIAPGVLPADQSLTLSEVSYLPNQPPNLAITGVGPGLILTFAAPIQPSAATLATARAATTSRGLVAAGTSNAPVAFQFSVKTANNNVSGLIGSMPAANFVDAAGISTFAGVDGNYDSTLKVVTGNVRSDLLTGFANDVISVIQFTATNITNVFGFLPLIPGPLALDVNNPNKPDWVAYKACPTGKTLVLVHGMLSSVENAFPGGTAQGIKAAGGYDSVVGFDYNWLQGIDTSGADLAAFLSQQQGACTAITELDIEAHSEGVPVSLYSIAHTNVNIKHFVSLGGPIMGTQAANDIRILQAVILATPGVSLTAGVIDLATILASPFVADLQSSTRGDNSKLDQIRSALFSRSQQPQMFVVGGTAERLVFMKDVLGITITVTVNMSPFASLMGTNNFDGIIPLRSALAFDSGLKVYPLPPFPVGHTELVANPDPLQTVGQQVMETRTPALLCESSLNCGGSRNSTFQFTGDGFIATASHITIFSQDSAGAVVLLPTAGLQDNSGSINWSMPPCSELVGMHSIFAFDRTLASNNIMLTADVGTCPSGPSGTIFTVAGNGTSGYSGDGGPAISAQLSGSSGVVFDSDGNMFIADSRNNVLRRVDALTHVITTIAGNGIPGYSGDGGAAINAQLNAPTHLTFDGVRNFYITDAGNARVRKVDATTLVITTVAGNGTPGFSGDGGPAINAQLNFPDAVALDGSGNLYIGDALNNRIRKVSLTTGVITTVAGNGTPGYGGDGGLATNAELQFPSRAVLDAAGNLYIADFRNNRVRRVDATTGVIVTVAGTGTAGYSGDAGPARSAELNGPLSVMVDTAGNLYIADVFNARIRVVNTGRSPITVAGFVIQPGNILTIAGNGVVGYQGDGGPATSAQLNIPTGLVLDSAGNLYFGDSGNNVVREVILH